MALIAPPQPPRSVDLDDGDGMHRVRLRLWQWWWTLVTIVATAWLLSLGWIPGIIGLVAAKHVLVAILVMGLGVDSRREAGI